MKTLQHTLFAFSSLCILSLNALAASPTSACTGSTVQNTNDAGCGSLRQIIADADADSIITFVPTLAGQSIVLSGGEISIAKSVTIDGQTTPGVQISGNGANRIFNVATGATLSLSYVTLTQGRATNGGAIYATGHLNLNYVNLTSNSANLGGAVFAAGAISINGAQFINNRAAEDGAALLHQGSGSINLINSLFAANSGNTGQALAVLALRSSGTGSILHSTFVAAQPLPGTAVLVGNGEVGVLNSILHGFELGLRAAQPGSIVGAANLWSSVTTKSDGSVNNGEDDVVGAAGFADASNHNYHLTAGSAAIDKARDLGLARDFEGTRRPQGPRPDIGFDEFEGQPSTPPVTATPTVPVVISANLSPRAYLAFVAKLKQ